MWKEKCRRINFICLGGRGRDSQDSRQLKWSLKDEKELIRGGVAGKGSS